MSITALVLAVAVLIILLASADALRRQVVGEQPAWTQQHLVWVIVGLAILAGANYILPVVFRFLLRL